MKKYYIFGFFAFRWGFPLDKCSPSLPRGSSKQRIARAKYIPSWIRMHAWNELFLSEQKKWILHLSSGSDEINFGIATANRTRESMFMRWLLTDVLPRSGRQSYLSWSVIFHGFYYGPVQLFCLVPVKKFSAYIVSQIRQSVSENYSVGEISMFLTPSRLRGSCGPQGD